MVWKQFPSALEAKTLALLKQLDRDTSFRQVAEATGLSENWLSQFRLGRLKHPSIGRVETLYVYLSGKKLEF